MAEFPTFAFTTQEDWYGELSFRSAEDGSAISLAGRQFQMYITPATSGSEPAAPVLIVGMSDIGLSLKIGDPSTLIFRVPQSVASDFARIEYTADIIEIVSGSRYLFMPVRVNFSDPSGLRAYLSRFLGISVSFAARKQPIVTPVAVAGREGKPGATIITGTVPPVPADGKDGDFFIEDRGAGRGRRMYGPKAGGAWPGTPWNIQVAAIGDVPGLTEALDAKVGNTLPTSGGLLAMPTVMKIRERRSAFDFIPWQRHSSILNRTISDDIDLSASLLDAATAAKEERKAVVFYGGNYPYLTSPNWAGNNVHLITEGTVRFRYTGTEDAFICDAGPVTRDAQGNVVAPGIFGMQVGSPGSPIIIEAPATAKNGAFIRAIHRSEFCLNVRGCGPEDAAFFIAFGVCSVFHLQASVNDGGWYKGARPGYGIILDRQLGDPADFSAASFLVFPNPKIEATRRGVSVRNAGGCHFSRGTIEGCIEFGLDLTSASSLCTVDGVDFEANGGFDIRDNGTSNAVLNAQTLAKAPDGTATSGLIVGNTAVGARIEGGAHNSVAVLAGAKGVRTAMFDVGLDTNGSMFIQPGAEVYRSGVFNRQTQAFLPDLGVTAAARSIKANLLAEPRPAQDVSLSDLGQAISLGITSDDLATFRVRMRAVRVAGFSSVGDVGDGAIYVSADTASGPKSIFNGSFYWNLTFPGDVQIGHFGAGLGGDDTAAVTAALTYAIAQRKRAVLPRRVVLVDAVQPSWPTNGTPFSPGRLWLTGAVQGGSVIRKVGTGGTGTLLTIGETPSKSIKNDIVIEGVTFDGVSIDKTYSGYNILDAWRVSLRNVESVNCQFGHQLLGCIYLNAENVNNHACRYGGAALNLNESYFAPLIGPSNIHQHTNCTYNENTNRGYIFDYGSMLIMLACNIEYNGTVVGDADHGGLYVGDKIGYALPGTIMQGAHLIGCWFENNKGREQINLRSGRNILDATQFVVPPGFSTYGVVRDGGVLSITNGTVFAADFSSGNVFDTASAALGGNRITSDCALYSLKINPDLWFIERIQGQGATVRLANGVSVPNNATTNLPWNGLLVDSSAPCFSSAQNTRMTVPANARRVRLSAGFVWASNGVGIRQISIVKNGSEEVALASAQAHGFNSHSIVSPVLKVVPGDYFEVRAFQNSGGALSLNFNQADAFQMEIVS